MSDGLIKSEQYLQQARVLVGHLESENYEEAEKALGNLTQVHESEIYQELGKLTRQVHSTLSGFDGDSRIEDLARNEIPDARDRLNYVIEMTDQAAHKTLNAVEESIPICEEIARSTDDISQKWGKFLSRDMDADQFRAMAREIGKYLESSAGRTNALRESLSNILIAQDYQDLTGQTIRKVITLVHELEENLVSIIKLSSRQDSEDTARQEKDKQGLRGPQIPGREDSDAMKNQDEVDDLLSSLGF